MVCSNCGYENPRDHRYCGMCGTPFPYRSLTVPGAQSTLSFTSTLIDAASVPVVDRPAPLEAEPEVTEPIASSGPEPESAATAVVTPVAEATGPPLVSEPAVRVEETPPETLASVPKAEAERPPV